MNTAGSSLGNERMTSINARWSSTMPAATAGSGSALYEDETG
jgi:hypothetical protein